MSRLWLMFCGFALKRPGASKEVWVPILHGPQPVPTGPTLLRARRKSMLSFNPGGSQSWDGVCLSPFRIAGLDPALTARPGRDPGGNGKFAVGASAWEDH